MAPSGRFESSEYELVACFCIDFMFFSPLTQSILLQAILTCDLPLACPSPALHQGHERRATDIAIIERSIIHVEHCGSFSQSWEEASSKGCKRRTQDSPAVLGELQESCFQLACMPKPLLRGVNRDENDRAVSQADFIPINATFLNHHENCYGRQPAPNQRPFRSTITIRRCKPIGTLRKP